MESDTQPTPLVILGLDAGDPAFIRKWARQGYLPTISSIMERGCWGETGGYELISEHGVWVSLFSGISRGQHGYYYFRQLKPGTYDLEPVAGPDMDVRPFWSGLRDTGKTVAIVDVPDCMPERGLNGVQLINWAIHDTWNPTYYQTISEPPGLLSDVHEHFGTKLESIEEIDAGLRENQRLYSRILRHVEKKGALCRHLLPRDRLDLAVMIFAESHAADHQFWKYCPEVDGETATENTDGELTNAIRDVYQAIDRELGLLLAQLPDSANVVIVSSVGMEDDYPTTGLMEAFCRQLGYQATPEAGAISFRPMDLARRLLPRTWRVALSRHLSWAQREGLLAEAFRNGTDWSTTTAFAIPALYTSFVRVNLRGREPQGIVEPGADYDALLDRIAADLRQLIDPETNEPAVTEIRRTVDAFSCAPHATLPDLWVEWKPGRYMERVEHPRATLSISKPEFSRRSDHSARGFVAAAGPSIRQQGDVGTVEVLDLAPTFLSLMGEPVPPSMSGQVLEDVIKTTS